MPSDILLWVSTAIVVVLLIAFVATSRKSRSLSTVEWIDLMRKHNIGVTNRTKLLQEGDPSKLVQRKHTRVKKTQTFTLPAPVSILRTGPKKTDLESEGETWQSQQRKHNG